MSNPIRSPEDCRTMEELRAEIDRVDTALFDLFAERMAYIHRAPGIKGPQGIPADVPERVNAVVDNARRRARERSLDENLYAAFWQDLVARAIAAEEAVLNPDRPTD